MFGMRFIIAALTPSLGWVAGRSLMLLLRKVAKVRLFFQSMVSGGIGPCPLVPDMLSNLSYLNPVQSYGGVIKLLIDDYI